MIRVDKKTDIKATKNTNLMIYRFKTDLIIPAILI